MNYYLTQLHVSFDSFFFKKFWHAKCFKEFKVHLEESKCIITTNVTIMKVASPICTTFLKRVCIGKH